MTSIRNKILALSHDVSQEARDDHGRWTSSVGSGKLNKSSGKKKNEKKKISKKKIGLVAAGVTGYVGLGAAAYLQEKQHKAILNKMKTTIKRTSGIGLRETPTPISAARELVRQHSMDAQRKGIKVPDHINKLAKQIHYYDKFNRGTFSYKRKVTKALRKHYNIPTLGQHVKHAISKAISKFRPLKVVKVAGLLS